jgi:hypothetical protein
MTDDTWVTYITRHPTGFWYGGKSSKRRIDAGYTGSGPRLKCAFLRPGFEPITWTTTIVGTHLTETLAFIAEEKLVPLMALADPYCLNSQPGGNKRNYGSPHSRILKQHKAPKAKKLTLNRDGTVTKGKK